MLSYSHNKVHQWAYFSCFGRNCCIHFPNPSLIFFHIPKKEFNSEQLQFLKDMKIWETNRFVVNVRKDVPEVYVGRRNPRFPPAMCMNYKYGNPFKVDGSNTREERCLQFEEYLMNDFELQKSVKRDLKGKTLGCWCYPLLCHAMILARVANS